MDLNIRGFDPEVKRLVDMAASSLQMTQKNWIMQVLELEAKRAVGYLEEELSEQAKRRARAVASGQAPECDSCDVCDAPCVLWGKEERHCTKCGRNFPR